MASVIIGDYNYTVIDEGVRVTVVDRTKSAYLPIESPVTIDGNVYYVTSMNACFDGCRSLTQAPKIPSSVTSMNSCFEGCTSLTQAPEIPSSVTNMVACFEGCTSLNEFLIVHNIPIHYGDIFNDVSLKVISVGSDTYEAWSNIVADYPNVSMAGTSDLPNSLYINNADGDYSYIRLEFDNIVLINIKVKNKLQTSYAAIPLFISIANRQWNIGDLSTCFQNCTSLTQAPEIPSSVTSMNSCFDGCTSLTQAPKIPSSVTRMASCFRGCTSLTQAPEIPSGVTSMYACFQNCTSLTQAPEIPSGVTSMYACFDGCRSLTQAPEIPSGVTSMYACFWGCTSLTQAPEIPSSVTSMVACFDGCTSLTQAPEIPSSVTNMYTCFRNCTSLTGNVKIAANISFIQTFADTVLPIYLINNTSPKDIAITATLKQLSSTQSNLHFETDDLVPPTSLLKVVRVDDDEDTVSSIDGLWAYLNAITTVYNTGLPVGWRSEVNGGAIYVDSVDVTNSAHVVGPILDVDKYVTDSWYDLNDVLQHTLNFGIKLDIYDDTNTYVYTNIYPGQAVILSSSLPLVSYKNGGDGIALGQVSTLPGFYCNLDTYFKDANNVIRALFDFVRPVGSTYSTLDADFDPNVTWGGTWEKLPEGYVLLSGSEGTSAGDTYVVGEDQSAASGYKEYGSNTHTLSMDEMPSHNHNSRSLSGSMRVMAWKSSTSSGIISKSNHNLDRNPGIGSNEGAETFTVNATHTHDSQGGGQAHSIMQKSIAVYWWIRTA